MSLAKTQVITGDSFWLNAYVDPFNKRVRIDDCSGNIHKVILAAEKIIHSIGAEKLIVKGRMEQFTDLISLGFCCEAKLDGYFLGADAYFFAKFYREERRTNHQWVAEDGTIHKVMHLALSGHVTSGEGNFQIRKAELGDSLELANLYREVFPIYPTPVFDPDYIGKTIKQGTIYFFIEHQGQMVSAASAEPNDMYKNAELTDCATLVSHRKQGFVKLLLTKLEEELKGKGIFCAYSLSRAQSFGMNAAFYQLGYQYRGRLLNNCFIYNKLESMNVWVKDLSKSKDLER